MEFKQDRLQREQDERKMETVGDGGTAEGNVRGGGRPQAYPQDGVASTCRSYREYVDMFGLDEARLQRGPVLDVAGGAASFTARLRVAGVQAVAADPFYAGDPEAVIARAEQEHEAAETKIAAMAGQYDWSYYGSPEEHRRLREESLRLFADDFRRADRRERYVAASLPALPFADSSFDLVLCSHFLFLYGESFNLDFHRDALLEMLRVLRVDGEAYIYPLVTLRWEPYPHLQELLAALEGEADSELLPTRLPFMLATSSALRLTKRG